MMIVEKFALVVPYCFQFGSALPSPLAERLLALNEAIWICREISRLQQVYQFQNDRQQQDSDDNELFW